MTLQNLNPRSLVSNEFILRAAADLLSDEGENVEYDRAIVELVRDLLGLDWEDDTRQQLADYLRAMHYQSAHRA